MRILDLYCGAGGAGYGYHLAGLEVVGVDHAAQPRYPFAFVRGDALAYLEAGGAAGFDAIHASPPCQAHSALRAIEATRARLFPVHLDAIAATRRALERTGLPFVIENVEGAPLRAPVLLCGSMFDLGAVCLDSVYRQLRRHRLFEVHGFQVRAIPACKHRGQPVGVYGHGRMPTRLRASSRYRRGYQGVTAESRAALGVSWMRRDELAQAIPPAYTRWIGLQLRRALQENPAKCVALERR